MTRRALALAALTSLLAACGGGGSSPPPPPPGYRTVDLMWTPSREWGVNSAGGGYLVQVTAPVTGPVLDVPYAGDDWAPSQVTTTLYTGTYTFSVRAYAELDSAGGWTGKLSAPATKTISVP